MATLEAGLDPHGRSGHDQTNQEQFLEALDEVPPRKTYHNGSYPLNPLPFDSSHEFIDLFSNFRGSPLWTIIGVSCPTPMAYEV